MYVKFKKQIGKPMYIQLYDAICADILSGKLRKGMFLPSRRALAAELNIAQNTVEGAYKMLADTGYVTPVPRQGYVVSFTNPLLSGDTPWEMNAPEQVVFSPNGIDTTHINRAAYAKIMRDIMYNDGRDIFSYAEKGGEFELRSAISKYLYMFRSVKCSPDTIIIGAGAEYLVSALSAIFGKESAVIFENPCNTSFYRVLTSANQNVITLPLNGGRVDFDALNSSGGNILFIDPDTRFPRSSAMDEEERRTLLEWAYMEKDRYIIENCIGSEITPEQPGTLYSMDTENKVIYLGSFSRSFSPAVKTAYMVLPPALMEKWKAYHVYYYALTPKSEQLALADFLNKGYFTKHCRDMRRVYREKRKYFEECMSAGFGEKFKVESASAGTYITATLVSFTAEETKKAARIGGVKLLSLNSYNVNKEFETIAGDRLVIGYGDLTREKIRLGVRLWSDMMK